MERRTSGDGVRITRTRRTSPAVFGLVVLALGGWLVARALHGDPPVLVSSDPPTLARDSQSATPPAPWATPGSPTSIAPPRPEVAERMRQRHEEHRVERRANAEPPYTLNQPGEQAGLAAFPAPGTKPIKRGIVVPDDFELPEGYVRHYQTGDDGRRLPPILMFHPDVLGTDENGNAVLAPEDRIVPTELAPPGLSQRTLDETTDVDERVGRQVHSNAERPTGRH